MRLIHQSTDRARRQAKKLISRSQKISLSDFFPKGTVYFYGYPSGEESGFLNLVSPSVEELVAARANTCAGDKVRVMNFSATVPNKENVEIYKRVGLTENTSKVYVMPDTISEDIMGSERNNLVMKYICETIPENSLIMAQPFNDPRITKHFQIQPDITIWLNDKKHMPSYINSEFLPETFGVFDSGKQLADNILKLHIPLVIKVTSSSAGDGVYLCRTPQKLTETVTSLRNYIGTITAEQYIDARKNCGVQFGIEKQTGKIKIIAVSEQITTSDGEFLGGIVRPNQDEYIGISSAITQLKDNILPYAFKKGWYGVGCFDVLLDNNNKPYFIDANFRMTGMTAGILHYINSVKRGSLCTFSGEFTGSTDDFIKNVVAFTEGKKRWLNILSLSQNNNVWRFNIDFMFKTKSEAIHYCKLLQDNGVLSRIFNYTDLI